MRQCQTTTPLTERLRKLPVPPNYSHFRLSETNSIAVITCVMKIWHFPFNNICRHVIVKKTCDSRWTFGTETRTIQMKCICCACKLVLRHWGLRYNIVACEAFRVPDWRSLQASSASFAVLALARRRAIWPNDGLFECLVSQGNTNTRCWWGFWVFGRSMAGGVLVCVSR